MRLRWVPLAVLLVSCGESGPSHPSVSFPVDAPVLTATDLVGDSSTYLAVLAAEARRAPDEADLGTLLGALSDGGGVARAAARALGRLERPSLVEPLLAVVADASADAATRAEAANAVAQAARGADADVRGAAVRALLSHDTEVSDPVLQAGLARSIARIPPADDAQASEVGSALSSRVGGLDTATPTERLGLARAAFVHLRVTQRGYPGYDPAPLLPLIGGLLADPDPTVRRTAAAARRSVAEPASGAERALLTGDSDPGVRREGILWAGARSPGADDDSRLDWLRAGLDDPAAEVRVAAVQGWAMRGRPIEGCAPLIGAATQQPEFDDPGDAVSLAAIGALDSSCPDPAAVRAALVSIVESLDDDAEAWHRPASALVALASFDAPLAAAALGAFVDHPNPFARAVAGRAAAEVGDLDVLRRLSADSNANVREAALLGWGEGAPDDVLLAQLDRPEPQLHRAVAALLETRSGPDLAPALLDALDRISSLGQATSRDARLALLQRAGALGTPGLSDRITPYLSDPDPAVASLAATTLANWGVTASSRPTGLPSPPLPSFAELAALEDSVAVVTMASGDSFVIATLPFEAPTNAARFMRMVRAGDFDGLTWHRVVPNFVVQGGSPYANEYAGHGDFSRDEIGLVGHFQGTLGISTRGRDTGDGQPFFNLVDNLRLDHDYTVFGYLVEGLDAVRRVRAGDVIERIEVRAR